MLEIVDEVTLPGMAALLTAYLVLHLNADGRVIATETVQAPNDACVLDLVRARMDGRAIEVWDGVRFVEHLEASDSGSASLALGTNWYR
ncbi:MULTISPECIES: hypothetical protein [Methylobacterium]|uniref:Uncharacterized protein n=1 Tax=Methylobacterium thuringiense TaxID=1003091 RepID=A0ABQ4TM67_9HYPH|nr:MULTISPECIES: hypothetical protein [Methylobacterium]TXN20038.1 hypothetical protein FV217_19410 [Methylobacterium sp. WL9]GJE55959.1 hypothetical protein EKPJFOCH_2456 [Methylobacterium thuringiense]